MEDSNRLKGTVKVLLAIKAHVDDCCISKYSDHIPHQATEGSDDSLVTRLKLDYGSMHRI